MIKRILLILFGTVSVLLLASCGDSNVFDCEAELVTPENELTLDGEEVLLKGGPLIGGILDIQVVDSFLVVKASTKESQDFLYVYSIGGGDFAGSFVTEGRGENELLMPVYGNTYRDPQGRDMLYLFDLSLCKSFGFDVGQSVAEGKTVLHKLGSMPSSTLYANPISDSLHFARYPQPDCIAGDLFDNNGTVIEKTAVYPALSGYDYFDMLTSADAVFPGSKTIAMAMLKKSGRKNIEKFKIAVIDTVFAPKKLTVEQVKELRFIPGTDNKAQFIMEAGYTTASNVVVPIVECRAPYKMFLDTVAYRQEVVNLIDEEENVYNRYAGVKFGSMESANNEAGNWED